MFLVTQRERLCIIARPPRRLGIIMKITLNRFALLVTLTWFPLAVPAADSPFDGLNGNLGNLYRTTTARSRSISPENFTGEKGRAGMSTNSPAAKGAARDLGTGWKASSYVRAPAEATIMLAVIIGPWAITAIC